MSKMDKFKDFKKNPKVYFESQRGERWKYLERVIRRIDSEERWIQCDDDPMQLISGTAQQTLTRQNVTEVKTVASGLVYEAATWTQKVVRSSGWLPPLHERVPHKFILRFYDSMPILDIDTYELRHASLIRQMGPENFAAHLGEALEQVATSHNDIIKILPNSSWRVYLTTRGIRCIELGYKANPRNYANIMYSLPSTLSGYACWDDSYISSCLMPNRLFAMTTKEEAPKDFKPSWADEGDGGVPLFNPPCWGVFVDKPDLTLINAMPILEIGEGRNESAVGDVNSFHDQRIMETMTEQRWDFFWDQLRKRFGTIQGELKDAVGAFVEEYYEDPKL